MRTEHHGEHDYKTVVISYMLREDEIWRSKKKMKKKKKEKKKKKKKKLE